MKKTLLQKALDFKQRSRCLPVATPSEDELDLAMQRARGFVGSRQVAYAIGANNRQAAEAWVGRILARAVSFGMLGRK